jgi:hypothetical protein
MAYFLFSQNLQNLQNHFLTQKVANQLLSGGKAVAVPHPKDCFASFEGFVMNYYGFNNFSIS